MTDITMKNYISRKDLDTNIKSLIEYCHYLVIRWQDEWQYEDPKQYENVIRFRCKEQGFELIRVSKSFRQLHLKMLFNTKNYLVKLVLGKNGATCKFIEIE